MAESPRGSVGVRRDSSNETCHERRKRSEGSKRLSWGGGCRDAEFGLDSPKARQGSLTLSSPTFNDSPETETAKGHRRGLQKMWHKCALYVALRGARAVGVWRCLRGRGQGKPDLEVTRTLTYFPTAWHAARACADRDHRDPIVSARLRRVPPGRQYLSTQP